MYKKIKVECMNGCMPCSITKNNIKTVIEAVLESWHDTGCWWEGENEKLFYRIVCRDGGIREVFQDLLTGEWYLYKTYD